MSICSFVCCDAGVSKCSFVCCDAGVSKCSFVCCDAGVSKCSFVCCDAGLSLNVHSFVVMQVCVYMFIRLLRCRCV